MSGGVIGKFIYFWAFMIGVIVFGKIFGFMNDTKTSIIVLIAAALIYIVWVAGRSLASRRREEQEWQAMQAKATKKRGNKRR